MSVPSNTLPPLPPERTLRPRGGDDPRPWRPFLLALAMHLLLFAMLFVGVRWQSVQPVAVQAELWTPPPRVAPPEPEPVRSPPEPRPEARPEPRPEPPPAPKAEPLPRPDIALEREKQRQREEQARREAEAKKAAEAKKLAERREAEKREAEKRETEKREAARREAEARKVAEARKEAEAKKAADAKKQAEARREQERREAERAQQQAKAEEQQRQDYVKRMMSSAGGSESGYSGAATAGAARGASSGGSGGGVDGGYAGRISSLIRSNTVFQIPAGMQGNPKAEFIVSLLPDCSIASVKLRRSSGLPAWDQAAERAIQRSDPMPRPSSGTCPRELLIEHAPREERQ